MSAPPEVVEAMARAAHEANRAWCLAHGDRSQLSWEAAPRWQRASCIAGVRGVLEGNTPEQSHAAWVEHKRADGWTHGPTKRPEAKQHPCMVPYAELPPEQRAKDSIFGAVVRAFADAYQETHT